MSDRTSPSISTTLSLSLSCPSCIFSALLVLVISTCVSFLFSKTRLLDSRTMSGRMGPSLRLAAARSRAGSARLFSTQSSLRKEIRDAYILSASRTPTAKVGMPAYPAPVVSSSDINK